MAIRGYEHVRRRSGRHGVYETYIDIGRLGMTSLRGVEKCFKVLSRVIDAMERYCEYLKTTPGKWPAGAQLQVSRYSLGGHLASVFAELHPEAVQSTVVFNGPGRGKLGSASIRRMSDPARQPWGEPSIYKDDRYTWATRPPHRDMPCVTQGRASPRRSSW